MKRNDFVEIIELKEKPFRRKFLGTCPHLSNCADLHQWMRQLRQENLWLGEGLSPNSPRRPLEQELISWRLRVRDGHTPVTVQLIREAGRWLGGDVDPMQSSWKRHSSKFSLEATWVGVLRSVNHDGYIRAISFAKQKQTKNKNKTKTATPITPVSRRRRRRRTVSLIG